LYRLGGFLNLSGYAPNALLGETIALGQAQYLYKMGLLAGFPLYAGGAAEWGGAWDYRSEMSGSSGNYAGSVFTALDTGIGPVYLAYSQAEAGRFVISFTVGQTF